MLFNFDNEIESISSILKFVIFIMSTSKSQLPNGFDICREKHLHLSDLDPKRVQQPSPILYSWMEIPAKIMARYLIVCFSEFEQP